MNTTTSATTSPIRSLAGLASGLAAKWWPQLLALAAACAVVATTITGALGVGDVIRAGLHRLAVGRLGRIDAVVLGDGFFRRALADELATAGGEAEPRLACTPAVVLPVTLAATTADAAVSRATLLACDDPAGLGFDPPPPPLEEGGVVVNGRLASALGVAAGDTVVLRLPKRSAVPADSPLGRRQPESVGRRLRVLAVVADEGLGRFSLRPAQTAEPLAVMSLTDAQAILREGDVANAVFVLAPGTPAGDVAATIRSRLKPRLDDVGVVLEPLAGAMRLSSRRLVIQPEIDRAAERVLGPVGGRATLAFLANDIVPLERDGGGPKARIPYSTVLGIDATTLPAGPLVDASGTPFDVPLDEEIIIDRWMADDLAAQGRPVAAGDLVVVTSFMPETIHGRVEERTESFRVAGVAEMTGAAIDRSLVPEVEGVTDEDSIADWDPPFPFDAARVRTVPPHDEDDRYWKQYRATPKAFVSLAAARRLAGSRFGTTTAWHAATQAATDAGSAATAAENAATAGADLASRIADGVDFERAGIRTLPLRAEAEAAAKGSTPFGGLFLALSSFVVVAGLLLVWLLFGLLIAAQSRTLGVLAAVGFPPRRLAAVLLLVGGAAAVAGAIVGAVLGPLWTRLLVGLLGRAWDRDVAAGSAAVFAPQPVSMASAAAGAAATLLLAVAALAYAAWRAGRQPPLMLLRGNAPAVENRGRGRRAPLLAAVMLAAAVLAAAAASRASADAAVGLFFAAGFAALAGLLGLVRTALASRGRRPARDLLQFAARTLAARPGRAFSIAAIVACGQFLVVAVSAFAVRPPADPSDRRSPTGGWTTIATFGEPTSIDPADPATRDVLGLSTDQGRALAGAEIALLRVSDGDDASCTNLNATTRPTVVGVGPAVIDRGGFRFVGHAPLDADAADNPWRLLDRLSWEGDTAIPAVLDQATAQWGLKLGGVGSRFTLPDEAGDAVEFRIVGLLEPGILQGRVIVSETAFQRLFPSRSGYGMALLDTSGLEPALRGSVPAAARAAWADAGVTLEPASERLRGLQAVQNTFLAGFQALGTLGLLLGTAGVAAVQVQGVVERLGGLAVLRAVGFTLLLVRSLLALETLVAVGLGIIAGTLAGGAAVWPALAGGTARLPLAWIIASGGLTLASAILAGWLASARTVIPQRPTV
jgi:ABC-type lipoprotein release transport system permease subunit